MGAAADTPVQGPAMRWDARGLTIADENHPRGWLVSWDEIDRFRRLAGPKEGAGGETDRSGA